MSSFSFLHNNNNKHNKNLVVVAPTFYADTTDARYELGLAFCRQAAALQIRAILVDASPDEAIRQALRQAGQGQVNVILQTGKGKKGAALRQALQLAYDATASKSHEDDNDPTILCFQEPEKVDMLRHWSKVAEYMYKENIDICNPRRQDYLFQSTYPTEQYHSENFVNLYLDAAAAAPSSACSLPSLDWTMGPIALRRKWAPQWQAYDGDLWDAQMVPMIRCHVQHGAVVGSCTVPFSLPAVMKQQEQGSVVWCQKRLAQINLLVPILSKEFAAAAPSKLATLPPQPSKTNLHDHHPPVSEPNRLTQPQTLAAVEQNNPQPMKPADHDLGTKEYKDQEDPMGIIKRFANPHLALFPTALEEIRQGRKESHWMWYMFPTPPFLIDGVEVGSTMNRYYALRNDEEAVAFLQFRQPDVDLRRNYLELLDAVEEQLRSGRFLNQLFPYGDHKKVLSSLQLFERIGRTVGDDTLQDQCHRILALDERQGSARGRFRVFSARNRLPLSM